MKIAFITNVSNSIGDLFSTWKQIRNGTTRFSVILFKYSCLTCKEKMLKDPLKSQEKKLKSIRKFQPGNIRTFSVT